MTEGLFERAVLALERIALALEALTVAPEETPAPVDTGCAHPEDQRISFGVTDGQPDWQCGACGYRTVAGE